MQKIATRPADFRGIRQTRGRRRIWRDRIWRKCSDLKKIPIRHVRTIPGATRPKKSLAGIEKSGQTLWSKEMPLDARSG